MNSTKPSRAEINAQNARHSTGPRTPEGKLASSRNAIKHGLTAAKPVVLPEEAPEFESFRDKLWHEIEPEGALEDDLFENLLHASLKMQRVRRLEDKIESEAGGEALLDPKRQADLTNLARHFAKAERTYHRSLNQLKQLQTERMCRWQISEEQAECLTPLASASKVAKQTHLKWPKDGSNPLVTVTEVLAEVFLAEKLKKEVADKPANGSAAAAEVAAA